MELTQNGRSYKMLIIVINTTITFVTEIASTDNPKNKFKVYTSTIQEEMFFLFQ